MSQEQTTLFDVSELDTASTRKTLEEVFDALEERGYDPVKQIVGYLISGDPGYISSYKDARAKMRDIDRAKVVEILLKEFRENK